VAASVVAAVISLTLPYPPTVNHYWGTAGKRRYIKPEGIRFRLNVAKHCYGKKRMDGELAVYATIYPPDKRRRDLDNVLKALLDALQHAGCYDDDTQIGELHILRGDVLAGGKTAVCIFERVGHAKR